MSLDSILDTLGQYHFRETSARILRHRNRSASVGRRPNFPRNPSSSNLNLIPLGTNIADMSGAGVVTQNIRFCGHVGRNHPDKQRLENYDVDKWLADTEGRIASFNITSEANKIKQAMLLVSPDVGDAHSTLNCKGFAKIATFDEFKAECRLLWSSPQRSDRLLNLYKFRSANFDADSMPNLYAQVQNNLETVKSDMMSLPKLTVGGKSEFDDENKQLVDLDEVLTYIAYGTLYAVFGERERQAFKEIELDPTITISRTLSQIQDQKQKRETKIDEATFMAIAEQKKHYREDRNREVNTNRNYPQYYQNNKPHYRTNTYREGDHNKGNHYPKGARPKNRYCRYCQRVGHTDQDCWYKGKKGNHKGSGKQSHNTSQAQAKDNSNPPNSTEENKNANK